jgi:hypothetical protein
VETTGDLGAGAFICRQDNQFHTKAFQSNRSQLQSEKGNVYVIVVKGHSPNGFTTT